MGVEWRRSDTCSDWNIAKECSGVWGYKGLLLAFKKGT